MVLVPSCSIVGDRIIDANVMSVAFAIEDYSLVGAVIRPPAWPSFKYYSKLILILFWLSFPHWRLENAVRSYWRIYTN
ncbi:hypothetical protein HID58_086859, partial [Brassica napus]